MGYNEMDKVWDKSQASKTDKLVLLAIARRYKPGVGAWPSQDYLAKICGVHTRSVRASIVRLEALGELTWVRGSNLSKKANLYFLTAIEGEKTTAELLKKHPVNSEKTSAETGKNTRLLNKELNKLLNSDFERFWSLYPRKESRSKAEQAFSMLTPNLSIDALLSATQTYRDSVAGRELKFVKLACNWLEQECWLDQVEVDSVDDWMGRAVND
jgi:hypothetical protein